VAVNRKFTRIPKINDLLSYGVPVEVIPTYCCLADHTNNQSGLCFPKMETMAAILNRSVRTIQRHLHLLKELGLIEFVERRRKRGRFSSYLYRVLHIAATTGHGKPVAHNKKRTKSLRTQKPSKDQLKADRKEGYWWFFGEEAPPGAQEEWESRQKAKREEAAKRRIEGYEWFFA